MSYKKCKQYRLFGYDYSSNGAYFITIVTKDRHHFLGQINNGEMALSPVGQFIEENFRIVEDKVDYIQVDEYVIMPNHLHLIITISKTPNNPEIVVTGLQPLVKHSVSAFVNQFKGKIKRWCNENGHLEFAWQARFHDRIIRDEKEYFAISTYIKNNVANWDSDTENQ